MAGRCHGASVGVEPGRIVVEAGATENGLGAGLERHRRRVKVGGPGRIEDRFAVHRRDRITGVAAGLQG